MPNNWRRLPTPQLEALLNALPDDSLQYDRVADELDLRSYDEPHADSPSLQDVGVMPSYAS